MSGKEFNAQLDQMMQDPTSFREILSQSSTLAKNLLTLNDPKNKLEDNVVQAKWAQILENRVGRDQNHLNDLLKLAEFSLHASYEKVTGRIVDKIKEELRTKIVKAIQDPREAFAE